MYAAVPIGIAGPDLVEKPQFSLYQMMHSRSAQGRTVLIVGKRRATVHRARSQPRWYPPFPISIDENRYVTRIQPESAGTL